MVSRRSQSKPVRATASTIMNPRTQRHSCDSSRSRLPEGGEERDECTGSGVMGEPSDPMEVILLAFRRHKQLKGLLDILVRGGQCDWPARFCLRREICDSSVFQG